jgi:chemotaxis signal transduction protein
MKHTEFFTFKLGGYNFAIQNTGHQKIIQYLYFDYNGHLPFVIKCIYKDGSESFPLVDTRLKLGMKGFDTNSGLTALVVKSKQWNNDYYQTGYLMDKYTGSFKVNNADINDTARFKDEFLEGICKINGQNYFIIAIEKILSDREIAEFINYQNANTEHMSSNKVESL